MRKVLLILLAAANVVLCVFILRGPSYSARVAAQTRPDPAAQTSVTAAPSYTTPPAATRSPDATLAPAPPETEPPAPTVTDVPAPIATEAPALPATDAPAPAVTDVPAPIATEAPAPPATDAPAPARDWSLVGRPEEEDFDWYWDLEEIPDDAVWMTRLDELAGNWKTMTLYLDHDDETLLAIELATIGIATESINLIYQWDKIVFDGDDDWYDESGDPALVYSYELPGDGTIFAEATGNTIELYVFWEYGGKQYALGDMTLPDGASAYMALVRP